MKKNVAVIINPNAGQQKMMKAIDQIAGILLNKYSHVDFFKTEKAGEASQLIPQIVNQIDLLIIAGGDGTVYEAVNALAPLDDRPTVAIIPGGTCNDFSRAIGMDQDPVNATKQITLESIKKIDVGQTDHQYFLNFWGIGLITQVSSNINSNIKNIFGRLSYYLSTLQQINEGSSFQYNIKTPVKSYEGEADMIIVSNGPFTGGVKPFFTEVDVKDGLFDVLILKQAKLQSLISMIKSKVRDLSEKDEDIILLQTNELTIETHSPELIDCDGERKYKTPSHLKILPKHIKMIVGHFDKV